MLNFGLDLDLDLGLGLGLENGLVSMLQETQANNSEEVEFHDFEGLNWKIRERGNVLRSGTVEKKEPNSPGMLAETLKLHGLNSKDDSVSS